MIKKSLQLLVLLLATIVSPAIAATAGKIELSILQTDDKQISIHQAIKTTNSSKLKSKVVNLGVGVKNVWIKTSALKDTAVNSFILDQSRLYEIGIYYVKNDSVLKEIHLSETALVPSKTETGNIKLFAIDKKFADGATQIYFNIKCREIFILPITFDSYKANHSYLTTRELNYGLYSGAVLIILLYHIFIYFSVKDKNYLLYILYILFTWLTQISIMGFTSKYFWQGSLWMHQNSVVLFSMLGLIFGLYFTTNFLKVKAFLPKLMVYYNILLVLSYIILVVSIFDKYGITFALMQIVTLVCCILAYYSALKIYFDKKYFPARFYLIAWSILIIGVILFLLKDYEIIPYNNFTIYIIQLASILEIALLSFALADKINFFKRENERSQAEILNKSLENAKLIKEQNVVLERKVKSRTEQLENTNANLSTALNNLKATQSQLVDAEKMAALGQLTAGIAHEINNPINFVTSNVKPLQLDIDDLRDVIKKYEALDLSKDIAPQIESIESYKRQIDLGFINSEITSLLSGISDGAKRTAEIIRSLRNFSRVDETDVKPIDLNEGITSTLVLIKSTMPDNLTVIKELGNLPKVECMPGKINQVFMNLVANAVQAIKSKEQKSAEEFLKIKTWFEGGKVYISIKDSGTGMPEEVKQRIFEPFFTTKDIGEGTGLGLSIVFSIIEKHNGSIEVKSELGEGTEFIIILHVNIP